MKYHITLFPQIGISLGIEAKDTDEALEELKSFWKRLSPTAPHLPAGTAVIAVDGEEDEWVEIIHGDQDEDHGDLLTLVAALVKLTGYQNTTTAIASNSRRLH